MLSLSQTILYYKRPEIQRAIAKAASEREIAVKYGDRGFGRRPDVIKFPQDVLEFAKKGASSFHVSEERWKSPLQLNPGMSDRDKDELRSGWDLVIDIDCHYFEYSRIAAQIIIELFRYHKIKSISCKFSGNKGFHIGIPFEAFPKTINGKDTRLLFPEAPRRIASYIKKRIIKHLAKRIFELEGGDFTKIKQNTGFEEEEIKYVENDEYGIPKEHLDANKIADIDTLLISSRHLYRMSYSFNEKSGLVSIPIDIERLSEFSKKDAAPDKVNPDAVIRFLDSTNAHEDEARELFIQAYDMETDEIQNEEHETGERKEFSAPEMAIDRKYFPPCINTALKGMSDGRKRALFAMVNFLKCVSWDKANIEKLLEEWNRKNPEPLRETTIKGQLRYRFLRKEKILPPNCMQYYKDIGICRPDNLCRRIKNPVQYSMRKSRYEGSNKEKKE